MEPDQGMVKSWMKKPESQMMIISLPNTGVYVQSDEDRDNFAIAFAAWCRGSEAKAYIEAGASAGELLKKYKSRPYVDPNALSN